jgi:hypothetical protein
MEYPVEGMTVMPAYMPELAPAWASFVNWAITQDGAIDAFKNDTGIDLREIVNASPFEAMVDQATGRPQQYIAAFCDWVTKSQWGVEGEIEPDDFNLAA